MLKQSLQDALKLIRFSIPIAVSSLTNMIGVFIAFLMVGKLGKLAIAASALGFETYLALSTIVFTSLFAISILISGKVAKGDYREAGAALKSGLLYAYILGAIEMVCLFLSPHFLIWFHQDPTLVSIATPYLHYMALAQIVMLPGAVLNQFFIGIKKPGINVWKAVIRIPFTLFFAYAFIYGAFGFHKMGLAGVGVATFVVNLLSQSITLVVLFFTKLNKQYALFSREGWWRFDIVKKIFNVGFPIGLQFGGELAAMAMLTYFMGWIGVTALAANQIVSQFTMLLVMISLGVSQALSIFMSQAKAESNLVIARSASDVAISSKIQRYFTASVYTLLIWFIITAILFIGCPQFLASLYLKAEHMHDAPLLVLTISLFFVTTFSYAIDAARNFLAGMLRGLGDSKSPMIYGLFGLWFISLPMGYLLGVYLKLGPVALILGATLGYVVAVVLSYRRFVVLSAK